MAGTSLSNANQVKEKKIEVESKAEKYQSAAGIDFAGSFGLSFPSLTTLGARIEQARQAADPVGLAQAANELLIAEKVSGKKAPISADDLRKQAVKMALNRQRSSELQAVALLTSDAAEIKAQCSRVLWRPKRTNKSWRLGPRPEKPRTAFSTNWSSAIIRFITFTFT